MIKRILGLVFLSFLLSSYDPPHIHIQGVVLDKNTLHPIDSALISDGESILLYSDKSGNFLTDQLGFFSNQKILFQKKGYVPIFIDFSNIIYEQQKTTIKLQPTTRDVSPQLSQNALRLINTLIKIIFSFLNILTLIILFINDEIRWRYLWITGIIFLNLIFNLFYVDFRLLSYEIIHAPIFLSGYSNSPYSLKVSIPIVSIIFWLLYLLKREFIIEDILEIKNDSKP